MSQIGHIVRSFDFNQCKRASPDVVSSFIGKSALKIWTDTRLEEYDKDFDVIHFGPWLFLTPDFYEFQQAIIRYTPEIVRLLTWVSDGEILQDFVLGCTGGTNREMVCDWCRRVANKGFDDESDYDGDEDVSDIMFGSLQILDCCFVKFFQALLDWAEQAIVWTELYASEREHETRELRSLAVRGETAIKILRASEEIMAIGEAID